MIKNKKKLDLKNKKGLIKLIKNKIKTKSLLKFLKKILSVLIVVMLTIEFKDCKQI